MQCRIKKIFYNNNKYNNRNNNINYNNNLNNRKYCFQVFQKIIKKNSLINNINNS